MVEDSRILRESLRALLDREPDIDVVGEAADGVAAVDLVAALAPDIVSMKVLIPKLNGMDATRQIVASCPRSNVLAIGSQPDRTLVTAMIEAGALGYLTHDCSTADYIKALNEVAAGRMYFSSAAVEIIVKDYLAAPRPTPDLLSGREREVLRLIAQGCPAGEIGRTLFISVKTVETHRRSIMRKLGTYSVAGLTKYAIKTGLTNLD